MLTADLVAARRYKGELKLVQLDLKARLRAGELAAIFLDIARGHVGMTRGEFEDACDLVEVGPRERRLADGIRKLIDDRCEFDADDSLDPAELRREVFVSAAAQRREGDAFDRDSVIAAVAAARNATSDAVERSLYADLRAAHVLNDVADIAPAKLVANYDLAQAQAVLLRAVRVTVEVECASSSAYRTLFRKLKFLRLLHTITAVDDGAYRIDIDGPFSLFDSVTKYGLKLALIVPVLQECATWKLEADVRWGQERRPLKFALAGAASAGNAVPEDGTLRLASRLPDDVEELLKAIHALDTSWTVTPASIILELPGVGMCVPNLLFSHRENSSKVYLEVLGYWSRDAVWRRVELIERGLAAPILFAVGKHLRVSEAVLDEEQPSALYVYKRTMNAKTVLDRVASLAARQRSRPTRSNRR